MAQLGLKLAPVGLKMALAGLQRPPKSLKLAQIGLPAATIVEISATGDPELGPTWVQLEPSWSQVGARMAQLESTWSQLGSMLGPDRLK